MAQDPYGYETSAPTGNASVAMWASLAALVLAMVGPCTCYTTSLLSIPVGVYGAWSGLQARASGTPEGKEMSLAGIIGGSAASLWSLMWVVMIALYIGIYVFFIFFMVAAGAANGDF